MEIPSNDLQLGGLRGALAFTGKPKPKIKAPVLSPLLLKLKASIATALEKKDLNKAITHKGFEELANRTTDQGRINLRNLLKRIIPPVAELIATLTISKTGNTRTSAPASRTTGNNAAKSSSSGSSDPDPEPRRQHTEPQYTRLTLARALNATARFVGGAR
ncbi:hypothetical protein NT239_15165 [Chitinibacter sp. SCUT-21]|uniref:hypothetical protein n=1 Tax=Chitinibacter sp. SCUT-21 TaxID=2970891 RepID=UPI0035A65206